MMMMIMMMMMILTYLRSHTSFELIWLKVVGCVAVTGAGKTYTMLGKDDNPGIMAHALTELFTQMRRSKDEHVYKVTMSYLEVQYWRVILMNVGD